MELILEELNFLSSLTIEQQNEIKLKLSSLLNDLPLESLTYIKRIKILTTLLNECRKLQLQANIIEPILLTWGNHDLDIDGVIGDLAATAGCSIELLKYLTKIFPTSTPVSVLDTHIRTRYGTGMIFNFVADRILEAFGVDNLEHYEWKQLLNATEEVKNDFQYNPSFISRQSYSLTRNNKDVLEYIDRKLKEKNRKIGARIPEWISLKQGETEEVYLNRKDTYSIPQLKEIEEIKNFINSKMNRQKLPDSDIGDEAPLTTEEVIDMFVSVKGNFYNSEDKFPLERFYGPVNAIVGIDCGSSPFKNDEGDPIGACRMFTCTCREYDDDEDDEEIKPSNAWFTGECEICNRHIRTMRYAVRFPIDGGGWLGCFCSFDCVRKTEIRPIYPNDETRIDEIENFIRKVGIADL